MTRTITLTDRQFQAVEWAIEAAVEGQGYYLGHGNPVVDYGNEWPEAAATQAQIFTDLAEFCESTGPLGLAADCRKLAGQFLERRKPEEEREA